MAGSGGMAVEAPRRLGIGSGDVWMGSTAPWVGTLGVVNGLSFFIFYLIYRGGHFNRLGKD